MKYKKINIFSQNKLQFAVLQLDTPMSIMLCLVQGFFLHIKIDVKVLMIEVNPNLDGLLKGLFRLNLPRLKLVRIMLNI